MVAVSWDSCECVYPQRELLCMEGLYTFTFYILEKDTDEITRQLQKGKQSQKDITNDGPAFMN